MLTSISEQHPNPTSDFSVHLLYSVRAEPGEKEEVLFLERLREIFGKLGGQSRLRLFVTGGGEVENSEGVEMVNRRIGRGDLEDVMGMVGEREGTVCYVCGVRGMTDRFVDEVGVMEGMHESRVLSEKWW